MKIVNPATGEPLQSVDEDTQSSVAQKFERARRAQREWRRSDLSRRKAALQSFSKLIESEQAELAKTLTLEMGKPITQSHNELNSFQKRIEFFADRFQAELEPEIVARASDLEEVIAHEPLGVVGNISAWNYPYFVGGNVILPALLTGNAVLYKPSELATLTGLEIVRLLHRAGVPESCLAPVVGGPEAGRLLCEQALDGLFFTGSVPTGRAVARAAAEHLIPVGLELGGKDPAYAASDVDVGKAAAALADGAFYNTGQSCCAVERIYVHQSIYEAFVEAFVAEVKQLKLGDPLDSATTLGPLARGEAQLTHLERQINDARAKGARILTGGQRAAGPGFFFEPTVLVDVDHSMQVMRDETFGPLIGLMSVPNDEAALELMNDTDYGLTAAVYTNDEHRAQKLLAELEVGSAYWNCCDRVSPALPWSGRRNSGLGTTLSTYGIEAFTQPKAWHKRLP